MKEALDSLSSMSSESESIRPLSQRLFGPVSSGSLRVSVLTMITLAVGAGIYAIPFQLHKMSLSFGVPFIALCALINYYTYVKMMNCAIRYKEFDYGKLCRLTIGPWSSYFLYFTLISSSFTFLIVQSVIIYRTMGRVIFQLFYALDYQDFEGFLIENWDVLNWKKVTINCALLLFAYIPIGLTESFTKFRFMSLFNILCTVYTCSVVIIQAPFYVSAFNNENFDWQSVNWFNFTSGFSWKMDNLRAFCVIMLAFNSHFAALPVIRELKKPTDRRIKKVLKTTVTIEFIFYSLLGVAGFLTTAPFPYKSELIIYRKDYLFSPDYFIFAALCALMVNQTFGLAANYMVLRDIIFTSIFPNSSLTPNRNFLITYGLMILAVTIGTLRSAILDLISVIGGFSATMLVIVFPILMFLRTNDLKKWHCENLLAIFVLVTCSLCGFTGAVLAGLDYLHIT